MPGGIDEGFFEGPAFGEPTSAVFLHFALSPDGKVVYAARNCPSRFSKKKLVTFPAIYRAGLDPGSSPQLMWITT
jgi:hypothetical protein